MSFNYDVLKSYGQLSQSSAGWTKELKLISWNDREAKYDLRDWAPDGEKMGKGITLSEEELRNLRDLLNDMDL
ncbi:MAG: hypothetical protein GX079_03695 [Tissierellia bacterium]|nr:hypothetical protein [Tissierellia bacterium]